MEAGFALGNKLDIALGIGLTTDLAAGANTGKRIHLRNYDTLGILFIKDVASAGTDDVVLQVREANANTGGTVQNMTALSIVNYYTKSAVTLAGTEAWVEQTQTANNKVTIAGATFATLQVYCYFDVETSSLSAGFDWASIDIADPGSGGTIRGTVIYIPTGLKIKRRPDLLTQPNA
jgi:hypothetical protein